MNTANKQHLPIDSIHKEIADRSSIFAVCFCFLFSIAAHFGNLPLWVSGIVILSLTWRCLQNLEYLGRVNNWFLIRSCPTHRYDII